MPQTQVGVYSFCRHKLKACIKIVFILRMPAIVSFKTFVFVDNTSADLRRQKERAHEELRDHTERLKEELAGTAMPYDVKNDIWNLQSHILQLKKK